MTDLCDFVWPEGEHHAEMPCVLEPGHADGHVVFVASSSTCDFLRADELRGRLKRLVHADTEGALDREEAASMWAIMTASRA